MTKTYAELGAAVKDQISHRARAFAQLAARLQGKEKRYFL